MFVRAFILSVKRSDGPNVSLSSCDVLQVLVKAGDKVAVGDPLMVMIAMKMEVRRCKLLLSAQVH